MCVCLFVCQIEAAGQFQKRLARVEASLEKALPSIGQRYNFLEMMHFSDFMSMVSSTCNSYLIVIGMSVSRFEFVKQKKLNRLDCNWRFPVCCSIADVQGSFTNLEKRVVFNEQEERNNIISLRQRWALKFTKVSLPFGCVFAINSLFHYLWGFSDQSPVCRPNPTDFPVPLLICSLSTSPQSLPAALVCAAWAPDTLWACVISKVHKNKSVQHHTLGSGTVEFQVTWFRKAL